MLDRLAPGCALWTRVEVRNDDVGTLQEQRNHEHRNPEIERRQDPLAEEGNIGHLIFNNPEKRNAFSLDMSIAAAEVMDDFLADHAIRVIVLSGAGDKAFVSGGDISKFEQTRATKEDVANYTKKGERFRTLLKTAPSRRSR